MDQQKAKARMRLRRHRRVRGKVQGTPDRPRLAVFRSLSNVYVQVIDDTSGRTLASASTQMPEIRNQVPYGGNVKAAQLVGAKIAEVAQAKGIQKVCFDRAGYQYHGRVKAVAEAARKAGLNL